MILLLFLWPSIIRQLGSVASSFTVASCFSSCQERKKYIKSDFVLVKMLKAMYIACVDFVNFHGECIAYIIEKNIILVGSSEVLNLVLVSLVS